VQVLAASPPPWWSTSSAAESVQRRRRGDGDAAEQRHAINTTTPAGGPAFAPGDRCPAPDRRVDPVAAASGDEGSLVPQPESESNPPPADTTAHRRTVGSDNCLGSSTVSSSLAQEERRRIRNPVGLKTSDFASQSAAAAAAAADDDDDVRRHCVSSINDVGGVSRSRKRSISRQFCNRTHIHTASVTVDSEPLWSRRTMQYMFCTCRNA